MSEVRRFCVLLAFALAALRTGRAGPAADPWAGASIGFLYGERELYPAALICFTDDSPEAPEDAPVLQLGDNRGVLSVRLTAPADHCPVRVTFAATPFYEESSVAVTLPQAGRIYFVAPKLRLNVDRLAAQKQPLANLVVHATVDGAGSTADVDAKVVVHSVNDCLLWIRPRPDPNDANAPSRSAVPINRRVKAMVAAYVNENNPWMDQRITRHALDRGYVQGFFNYLNGDLDLKEVQAVFDTLRDFGFRYVNFAQPSAAPVGSSDLVRTQSIRLVGDALLSSQANGFETAAILASVLRKMTVDTDIYVIPTQPTTTLLGIYTRRGHSPRHLAVIDLAAVGAGRPFAQALADGARLFAEERDELLFAPGDRIGPERAAQRNYLTINIDAARRGGVLPIPELAREPAPWENFGAGAGTPLPPMNTSTLAAAIPALLAQTPGSGMNNGGDTPSHRIYWIAGAIVVLIVLFVLLRRKKI